VTGAEGQLGRSVLAVAPRMGVETVACSFAELDVTDAVAIEKALDSARPDVVLNCAAFSNVDACETQPDVARQSNALGPELLAQACRGRSLLVHVSTDYVFSGRGREPISEDAPTEPLCVYGRTKLLGEQAVRSSGCEHLIVRTQWLFGPGHNFVRTILTAAGRGELLRVVDDQFGRPTWTGALAGALIEAANLEARGTLHLACEGEASWHEFATRIVEEGARRGRCPRVEVRAVSTREFPRPAPRPAYGVLALDRAAGLGLRLPHWCEALVDYLNAEEEKRDA
jgi:dTDP-4-dehydrorhamnose reductase